MSKVKEKEKNLKGSKRKITSYVQRSPQWLSADFSAEAFKPEGSGIIYLKCWKEKSYNQNYSSQQGYHSELKER